MMTPARPVFLTETGWNDDPRHEPGRQSGLAHPPHPRRARIRRPALALAAQACLVGPARYPAPAWSWRDGSTLVTPEFLAKPIYHAIQDPGPGSPAWHSAVARPSRRAGLSALALALLVALLVTLRQRGADSLTPAQLFPRGELRIGVEQALPPFVSAQDGALTGLAIDLPAVRSAQNSACRCAS